MPMTMEQMMAAITGNIQKRTGRPFEEWVAEVKKRDFPDRRSRVAWLKEQGFGMVAINAVLEQAERPEGYVEPTPADLLAAQYAGPKAALLPLYEQVVGVVQGFGDDIACEPRKTMVSLIRKSQFALILPSTRTRIDVGLKLKGVPATERLREAGSFGSGSVTHRMEVTCAEDVDPELVGWLRQAYEANR